MTTALNTCKVKNIETIYRSVYWHELNEANNQLYITESQSSGNEEHKNNIVKGQEYVKMKCERLQSDMIEKDNCINDYNL